MRSDNIITIINYRNNFDFYSSCFFASNILVWPFILYYFFSIYYTDAGISVSSFFHLMTWISFESILVSTFDVMLDKNSAQFAEAIKEYPLKDRNLNQLIFDGNVRGLCADFNAEQVLCLINGIPSLKPDAPKLLFPLSSVSCRFFRNFRFTELKLLSRYNVLARILSSVLPYDLLPLIFQFIAIDADTKQNMKNSLRNTYELMEHYHTMFNDLESDVEIELELLIPIRAHKEQMLIQFDDIINNIEHDAKSAFFARRYMSANNVQHLKI